jgi:hypothetical protein
MEDIEEISALEPEKFNDFVKEDIKNYHPDIIPQALLLNSYLKNIGSKRYEYIKALKTWPKLAFMNMKLLSYVIEYRLQFGDSKPVKGELSDLDVFLEDRYADILLTLDTTQNLEKKLNAEFKMNLKLNFVAYLKAFENLSKTL